MPSVEELQSTGSMARVIERLEGERDDLRRQVRRVGGGAKRAVDPVRLAQCV